MKMNLLKVSRTPNGLVAEVLKVEGDFDGGIQKPNPGGFLYFTDDEPAEMALKRLRKCMLDAAYAALDAADARVVEISCMRLA